MTGSVDLRGGDWLDDNRANWDERVPIHVASDFYDQGPLRAGGSVLDPTSRSPRPPPERAESAPIWRRLHRLLVLSLVPRGGAVR